MTLDNNLKYYRRKLNISQKDLSSMCGMSVSEICRIEKGYCEPSVALALSISHFLGISIEQLFYLK